MLKGKSMEDVMNNKPSPSSEMGDMGGMGSMGSMGDPGVGEIQSALATASPDQLEQIKSILGIGSKGPGMGGGPGMEQGGEMSGGLPPLPKL